MSAYLHDWEDIRSELRDEEPAPATGLCANSWCDDEALPDDELCASCRDELLVEDEA